MKRYVLNMSFKGRNKVENIVEPFASKKKAVETFNKIVDGTVEKSLILDRVTGKVTHLKLN